MDDRFTNIASGLLTSVRDLVDWGIETGNTTPEKLRLTVAARRETAQKLIESGMSQRAAAKVLGVAEGTIRNDLRNSCAENAQELRAEKKVDRRLAQRQDYVAEVEQGCTIEDLGALVRAGKRFSVIYADPPWSFKVYSGKGKQRSAERHYDTMSLDEIKALPVADLAADDCALMLWSVFPELPGALDVIAAWGFTYKTVGFVWVKKTSGDNLHWGMGYWTRANAEVCLLATRGAPKRQAMDVHQIIESPVGEHSRKPDEVQVRIERLLSGPYLELFGRRAVPGWTVWGNQITRGLFQKDIPEFVA